VWGRLWVIDLLGIEITRLSMRASSNESRGIRMARNSKKLLKMQTAWVIRDVADYLADK
jgi:hypothetical protein